MSDLPWADSWKTEVQQSLARRKIYRNTKGDESNSGDVGAVPSKSVRERISAFWEHVKTVDAALSLPIMSMKSLGWIEYLISFPGNLFGIPFFSLMLMPFCIASLAELSEHGNQGFASIAGALLFSIVLMFWGFCCYESKLPGINRDEAGIVRAFQPFGKNLGTVCTLTIPHFSIFVISYSSPIGKYAACYYTGLFYFTQLVVEFFKTTVRRQRPVAKLKHILKNVDRELPQIQHILSRDHAIHSSFPSGDASGATTFALVCFLITPAATLAAHPSLAVAFVSIPILSAFCRLYFHAHFSGDVLAGITFSMLVAQYWGTVFDPATFGWDMLAYVECFVILNWGFVQTLKPARAESIYNANGIGMGKLRRLSQQLLTSRSSSAPNGLSADSPCSQRKQVDTR